MSATTSSRQLIPSLFLTIFALLPAAASAQIMPEPNPPVVLPQAGVPAKSEQSSNSTAFSPPTTEWTLHKSANGLDPDGGEQQMMWLMNRARMDPTAEGIWLATSNDPEVEGGRTFFGVDLNQLQSDFAALAVMPPAAFDIRLHDASVLHSNDLIARDAQDHMGQVEKVIASGFPCNGGRFSVFSFSTSPLNAHAALNIDWGIGPGGVQDPPGHRLAIMGVLAGGRLSNAGLAIVPENNQMTNVGPEVFSGAYCQAGMGGENRFVIGTVWDDTNQDGDYDPGEGLDNVMVMPDIGTYYAITGDAGGYAFPASVSGDYSVTFSGGDLGATVVNKQVSVGNDSVLLDARPQDASVSELPVLLRRSTDNRWFLYMLSHSGVGDKGKMGMTRSPDYSVVSRDDFDGDGEADVLVRDLVGGENGRWVLYTLTGTTITAQGFIDLTRNSNWVLVSTDDFNNDNQADALLRNSQDGRWLLYLLNSHMVLSQGIVALSTDLTDSIAGTGDFNNDGKSDVLLRRANGQWLLYTMDGLNAPAVAAPPLTPNLQFTVQALDDFDGDNRIDVLLRRADGRWFMYTMNGANVDTSGSPSMSENPDFGLVATDDFDNDGNADVLLRRTDGRWFMYLLDGISVQDDGMLNLTQNTAFGLVETNDFSGDDNADILMRRSDGRWILYAMDGLSMIGSSVPDMTRSTDFVPQVQ